MNRRAFLKAAACGLGSVAAIKAGMAVAATGDGAASSQMQAQYNQAATGAGNRFIHSTLASNNPDPVGVRLILWFDVSSSIDENEYHAQLDAMASAIRSKDFQDALSFSYGPQSIALCVADFGTNVELRIPWLDVRPGENDKLRALAAEITGLERRENGMTSHVSALHHSLDCFQNCPWEAQRSIVDIMTDGKNNNGGSADAVKAFVKKLATDHEATVNALVTVPYTQKDLKEWSTKNLVTPGGFIKKDGSALDRGFVKIVAVQDRGNTLNKMGDAMRIAFRQKLILEVADLEIEELRQQVASERRAGPLGLIQSVL